MAKGILGARTAEVGETNGQAGHSAARQDRAYAPPTGRSAEEEDWYSGQNFLRSLKNGPRFESGCTGGCAPSP